jgi:hypothetical protein
MKKVWIDIAISRNSQTPFGTPEQKDIQEHIDLLTMLQAEKHITAFVKGRLESIKSILQGIQSQL